MPTIPEENQGMIPEMGGGEKITEKPTVGELVVEVPVTRESWREKAGERYSEILSKVTPTHTQSTTDDDDTALVLDAKHIGALTDEESKVQKLLDLAGSKGVVYAVKVARSLKDYYALDRMHDELAGKLYQGLLERGLIEKE